MLLDSWRHFVVNLIALGTQNLCQISYLAVYSIFNLVQFVPEILLYFLHIRPSIHSISLDVLNLLGIFLLCLTVTVNILKLICFIRTLDDNLSNFFWSFNFINLSLFLESPLNYLTD